MNELGIPPALPENWTVSSDGILDVSLSNAYSYWPEGAGTKTISIVNGTTAGISKFFLKLTDGGNFPMQWGSSIQWKNGSEPEWQAFNEDIIIFKSNDGGNTWTAQVLQTNAIQEYWKFTIQIPENETVYIPLDNHVDTIDWGDGSSIETVQHDSYLYGDGDVFKFTYHTYSLAGIYQIKVQSDNFADCYMATDDSDPCGYNDDYYYYECNVEPYTISIDSPLPCIKGTYQWPDDSSMNIDDAFDRCFCEYTKLVSIPDKLFYNNPQVKSFHECFYHCSSLQSIPSGLFDKNTAVVSTPTVLYQDSGGFEDCFYGCSSLQSIPSGLFDKNTAVTNFDGCFRECTSLQSIPSGLFDKNTAVTSFYGCFYNCSSLQSIPSGLFDKNTAAGYFGNCFYGCSFLQSIPSGLFDKNTAATGFSWCFRGCSSLKFIPSGLFDKNTAVTDFRYCFYNCTSLTNFKLIIGSSLVNNFSNFISNASNVTRILCVPSNSTTYNTATSYANSSNGITVSTVETDCIEVFEYTVQTDLSEFDDPSWDDDYSPLVAAVPIEPVQNASASLTIDWGDGNAVELQPSSVVEANLIHTYATAGTYQITVLSSNWSDYKFMAVDFVEGSDPSSSDPVIQTFRDKLVSLDAPMPPLANTDLIYWFQYCPHLTTINSHLFDNLPNVTSAKGCFARCESLTTVPEGLFAKNTAITSFSECFKNCFGLQTIPAGLFANNTAAADFSSCFNWNQVLQSIPAGLFANNTAATNFRYCFGDCYEIQTIPENLFASNTAVTNFYGCFYDCTNLGGFTIHIGSSLVAYADIFVKSKSGTTRIVYVPSGSTTQTTFNKYASSLRLTVRGE